jgi:hypothetical protein
MESTEPSIEISPVPEPRASRSSSDVEDFVFDLAATNEYDRELELPIEIKLGSIKREHR